MHLPRAMRVRLTSPKFPPTVEKVETWLQQGGARFDAVAIDGQSPLRRVVATRPIAAAEQVIFIPSKRVLDESVVKKSAASKALLQAGLTQIEAHFAAFLCVEMARDDSPWAPYMQALPTSYESMPHYHAAALARLLTGTRAREIIQNDVQWTRAAHQMIQRHVEALRDIPFETYLRAYFAVRTRLCATVSDDARSAALPPMVDMCNHALKPNAAWHCDPHNKSFSVTALRPIPQGEEVTISYGDSSNSALYARYGFTVPGNPVCEALLHVPDHKPSHVRVRPHYADSNTAHVFATLRQRAQGTQNIDVQSEAKVVIQLRTMALAQRQLIPTTPMNPGVHPLYDGASLVCADERAALDWFIDLAQAALPVLGMPAAERASAIASQVRMGGPYSDYFATLAAAT